MAVRKFTDASGLTEFWTKVKAHVTSAISSKQDTLVSGTSIKTVNNTSLLGSGNVAVQPTLVSGTNIKTVNGNTLLGSGDVAITEPTYALSISGQTLSLTKDGASISSVTLPRATWG